MFSDHLLSASKDKSKSKLDDLEFHEDIKKENKLEDVRMSNFAFS